MVPDWCLREERELTISSFAAADVRGMFAMLSTTCEPLWITIGPSPAA